MKLKLIGGWIGKTGFFLGLCLLLAACSGGEKPSADKNAADAQMLKLQIMIVNAVQMTVNGDSASALRVLRRAMSGPEMNAMHHGGKVHPMMKQLHDLGDALFSVLDEKAVSKADFMWHDKLAAENKRVLVRLMNRHAAMDKGAALADLQRNDAADKTREKVQHEAQASDSAYAKAVRLLIQRLRLL